MFVKFLIEYKKLLENNRSAVFEASTYFAFHPS